MWWRAALIFSLWSRLGAYEPAWLDELLEEKQLFEYWAHAASFLPIEDYPLYRRLCLEGLIWQYPQEWYNLNQEDVDRVLDHIRNNGEVKSSSFERKDGKKGTWWDWKIEKRALEFWFQKGEVMVPRRERFQRVYDLRQRMMPEWRDQDAPPLAETIEALCIKTLDALGVALPSWVADYFRLPKKLVAETLNEMIASGKAIEITIEGMKEPGLVTSRGFDIAEAASKGQLEARRTTLLPPFDALIWDRKRTKQLFDFDYTIEVYLPQAKRKYGYYLLPILHNGELVGRLDAKAHRLRGVFEVKTLYLEQGVKIDAALVKALAATIQDCANWHKTPEVLLNSTQPAELFTPLNNYFLN